MDERHGRDTKAVDTTVDVTVEAHVSRDTEFRYRFVIASHEPAPISVGPLCVEVRPGTSSIAPGLRVLAPA